MLRTFFLGALLLSGCATGYHAQSPTGGFSGGWLDNRAMAVRFEGNNYTKANKAGEYAMLRACELAMRRSFPLLGVWTHEARRVYVQHQTAVAGTYTTTVDGFQVSSYSVPAQFMSTSTTEGEVRAVALVPREAEEFRSYGYTVVDVEEYVREHASPELRDRILDSDGDDIIIHVRQRP